MRTKQKILTAGAVLASVFLAKPALAAVTPQGWWHYGEVTDYYADSSGNNRRFSFAFSGAGGGTAGAGIVPLGAGGPLGTTGYISTSSLYWTPGHHAAAGMWNPWPCGTADCAWNPPAQNYAIECWILPEDPGISTGANRTWFFGSGSGDFSQPSRDAGTGAGGVYFAVDKSSGVPQIGAFVIANASQGVPADVQIGDYVDAEFSSWMHVAVVNENGVNTFYVNGVAKGASTDKNTIPNGNIFAGCNPGTSPSFKGYLDELRISTFEAGQFKVSDLLLRPPGPSIITQPESATVWANGAASFSVIIALDASVTYQWRRGGANLAGETGSKLSLPVVTAADNGVTFDCVLTGGGVSVTTTAATLTVVTPTPADIANANAYRDLVKAESSLAAYFPADDCSTATVINLVDAAYNGIFDGPAVYDGRTNRALIQRSLSFDADSAVQIPANPAYEFASGKGTVEALVYLNKATLADQTLFAVGWDDASYTYAIKANAAGNGLVFANGTDTLSWSLAPNLIGRQTHVAFVVDNANVTPYVNGQPLETKTQSGLPGSGYPAWIGSLGASASKLAGTIGELAVYSDALSAGTIQQHYTKYVYGTTVAPPVISSQTLGPKTLIAGSAPVLNTVVAGALPFTYTWKSNNVVVAGANSASLTVVGGEAGTSATYTLSVANAFGTAESQPIVLNFAAPAGKYAEVVATDHPSAYWRLGEQTGTLAADLAGFNDATYGANGGALTLGQPGAFTGGAQTDPDTAVHFTGGNAVASYSPVLNPAGPFTIELWAKPDQSGQNSRALIGSQNRSVGRSGYAIYQGLNGAWWECHIGDAATVQIWLQGNTSPVAGKWYHIVVVYNGASGAHLYVNGVDETGAVTGNYLPNNSVPFEIASRSGGGIPYPGTLDDVAFYSYALTAEQVLNHYKIQWVASQVTEQPADVTATEGETITLSAAATGLPNSYQWYKGGSALVPTDNLDGTAHYPAGVTGTTLTIAQVTPADTGLYHLVVTNPLGNSTTRDASVVVNKDTTAPTALAVTALPTPKPIDPLAGKPYLVKVLFSKRMDTASAQNQANYSLNGGVTVAGVSFFENVTGAPLGADWRVAVLATSGLTPGQSYTLTISGLKDRTVSANPMATATVSFKAPVLTPSVTAWDYYYLGEPAPNPLDVYWLTGNTFYPQGPMTNGSPATFDTSTFTGNDLAGKAPFGALGSNYGDSLSAWITPTVSGSYRFFLSSDDPSQLWLSTDDSPVNVALIAEETGCCHAFTEPPIAYTSEPQALAAGRSYFLQAIHTEGGGGDYVKVAWRMEGDATPAAELKPISGAVLSAYASIPPKFDPPVISQTGQVTISWSGTGTLQQSADLKAWAPVAGNPASPYAVTPATPQLFYRLVQ